MKTIDEALAAHLAGRITTLCACWLVTRSDGVTLGFTDHDRTLTVQGVMCHPANGLERSAVTEGPGLAVGGGEVSGSLTSEGLSDAELEAGLWDGAEVRAYLVNWADPSQVLLERRATIGEVTRAGLAFRAELRGLSQALEARRGRVFSGQCDADLGDARCGVDLASVSFRGTGTVLLSHDARRLRVSGLHSYAGGWFDGGRLAVTNGALAGFACEVARHDRTDEGAELVLWLAAPQMLAPGTGITVTAGCDKRFATCQAKFVNALNFQGFPHMPGTDFVLSYPNRNSGENDGGAIVS